MLERFRKTEQEMLAFFGLAQIKPGTAQDDVAPMVEEQAQELDQTHLAGLPAADGQQDHAERLLHLREFVEVIEDELRLFAALDLDDDAHALAVGLVAHVGDAVDLFCLHQLGDALDEASLVDLVGNFGDDDILAFFAGLLDGGLGAHDEAAAPGFVGGENSFAARYISGGGKVGAGNHFHQFFERRFRVFEQQQEAFDDLVQVMRRNVGGHAHGDARRAIDQQVGHAGGQHEGLFARLIEIRNEIDGLFFEIGQQLFTDAREPRLGVPHGGRRIAIDRTKIALPIHQRVAQVKWLRQAHERGIDDRFSVRMIVARGIAANLGALPIAAIGGQAEIVHRDENPALDGLQAIPHVRDGARHDHAHGVIEVRFFHLRFDIHRKQRGMRGGFVGHAEACSFLCAGSK